MEGILFLWGGGGGCYYYYFLPYRWYRIECAGGFGLSIWTCVVDGCILSIKCFRPCTIYSIEGGRFAISCTPSVPTGVSVLPRLGWSLSAWSMYPDHVKVSWDSQWCATCPHHCHVRRGNQHVR